MTESTINQKVPVSIQDEMRTSYLDYAMSVIVGRAIPDVRDGLKPVHRRILYSMSEQNINANGPHKKCARVVGDVLGKYHPHGDLAVYDALVRMAQDFSLRSPLIDGQGNFGSIDGDSAAAMRYTECRLAALAGELLTDLDKDTVDFQPNYDDSEHEPTVLPAKFPQLLVNGSGGIAVGMATNIPPHNLGEICEATIALINNPEITLLDLVGMVPGPDFPTGGLIYGHSGIRQAYTTGRGSIVMRGRAHTEPMRSGDREQIIITEVPYQCNKARLVARIAELVREKRVEGISEVRDESDRDGIRVVVDLKKDIFPQVILNQLYRMTPLQSTFGVINLSIVDGSPRVLNLKDTIQYFVQHRREVVRRRSQHDLRQAEARRDLVEGLGMATTDIDLVVRTIRDSRDTEEARIRLMALPLGGLGDFLLRAGQSQESIDEAKARGAYHLSERQAKAILDMRLGKLTGLEREKLAKEYRELSERISYLREILNDDEKLMGVIVTELEDISTRYANPRRTEIVATEADIHIEDLIQEEDMAVSITHSGYIKRTAVNTYRAQKRGGKGRTGMAARQEDWVNQLFVGSTHSFVFFFTDRGRVFVKKVYEIPEAAPNARGRAIVNFVGIESDEKVVAFALVDNFDEGKFIVTLTRQGQIKKTAVSDYRNYRQSGIIGVRIEESDKLLTATVTDGSCELIIGTRRGMAIRFPEEHVRQMGRATRGVKGIDLRGDDVVVGMGVYHHGDKRDRVLTVCALGYGKQTPINEFRLQSRNGKGVRLIDASDRNGPVVGLALVHASDELIVITDRGQTLRTEVSGIRETGRNAQGVSIMRVAEGERIVAIETFADDADEIGDAEGEDAPANADGDNGAGDETAAQEPTAESTEAGDGSDEAPPEGETPEGD